MSANIDADTGATNSVSEFWSGARSGLPVIVAALPFGLLFGALAVANGFTVFEAMLMSGTVYGGASQMVGIELFGQKIAPLPSNWRSTSPHDTAATPQRWLP